MRPGPGGSLGGINSRGVILVAARIEQGVCSVSVKYRSYRPRDHPDMMGYARVRSASAALAAALAPLPDGADAAFTYDPRGRRADDSGASYGESGEGRGGRSTRGSVAAARGRVRRLLDSRGRSSRARAWTWPCIRGADRRVGQRTFQGLAVVLQSGQPTAEDEMQAQTSYQVQIMFWTVTRGLTVDYRTYRNESRATRSIR